MCGIAGIINHRADPNAGGIITAMNATLIPRESDTAGAYLDENVALGHRQIASLDLKQGRQPVTNEDGSVVAVFVGKIYNAPELRDTLTQRGHKFRNESDTELIVHLYEELGNECVSMLEGSFAFAAYNREKQRVLLARDRLGEKPLIYFMSKGMLVFASEFPALKCHPAMPQELDMSAVSDYLSFQYVPGPGSIYRNVHKLAPGHQMEFRINDGTTSIRSYWRLDYSLKLDISFKDAAAELRRKVERSVERCLISDAPVGCFLSGGLDSTIITALAAKLRRPEETNAYTVGFWEAAYDERIYASKAAANINRTIGGGLMQRESMIEVDDFTLVEKLAARCGEPYADASILPFTLLSKFAASEIKVALCGDGGDEFFCGYERYLAMRYASQLSLLPEALSRPLISLLASMCPNDGERTRTGRMHRFLKMAARPEKERYYTVLNRCSSANKRALFGERLQAALKRDSSELFSTLQWELTSANKVERLSELDLQTYLPGDLLPKTDIGSTAAELEVRAPFFDRDVIEFAAKLPLGYKLRGSKRKYILREAFKDLITPEIARRPKKGFGVPIAAYLRGKWHNLAEEVLFDGKLTADGYFNGPFIRKLWNEHKSGSYDHSYLLWNLVNFSLFLELNHTQ